MPRRPDARALLLLLWPLAVYVGLKHLTVRELALALLAVLALRVALAGGFGQDRWALALGAALALLALAGGGAMPLKLYPVAMNATMLAVFGWSLLRGPPVVERIARLHEPDLPPAGVRYTRRVTQAWCVFFVCNGLVALATALAGSDELWALYNGLLAYLLIGAMFGGEWLVRGRMRRRWAGHE